MKTALLLEDHEPTRGMLASVLREAFGGISVEAVSTVAQARARMEGRVFDLALLDISLPDGSGVDVAAELSRREAAHYIVMATVMDDDESLFGALRAGAQGYLLKEHLRGELVEQLRGIIEGRPPLSPTIARRILSHFHPDPQARQQHLTPREAEVLTLIARGATRKGIARQLALSPNTVSGYIKTIYQKLNIRSCSEATLEAIRRGLVRE
jgi:DNA-binding NarL/FixJ family response regulator